MPAVRTSLACWPGLPHLQAMELAVRGPQEPLFGALQLDHVQLVPQGADVLDEQLVEVLLHRWPQTSFRLHANVRVLPQRRLADLGGFCSHLDWFRAAARIHQALGATVYSAHAGRRRDASFAEMLDNARRCADLFGCPVAVEGMYPRSGAGADEFLASTWEEYQALLQSSVPYALDLSHLNILAHLSGQLDLPLVRELLASPACLEVHISANDGSHDAHGVLNEPTWWCPLLAHLQPAAVLFSEGNHRSNS